MIIVIEMWWFIFGREVGGVKIKTEENSKVVRDRDPLGTKLRSFVYGERRWNNKTEERNNI
jgi:hypothetical protein